MKLQNLFKKFFNDESGAVTVDWVVLTAAIVGLGMVVMTTVGGGVADLGDDIAADISTRAVGFEITPTP
jgi:Flp pilus assembly pilin Flp